MEALFLPNKKRQIRKIPSKFQVPFNELLCQYHSSVLPREKLVAVSPLSAFYRFYYNVITLLQNFLLQMLTILSSYQFRNASSYSTRNLNYADLHINRRQIAVNNVDDNDQ